MNIPYLLETVSRKFASVNLGHFVLVDATEIEEMVVAPVWAGDDRDRERKGSVEGGCVLPPMLPAARRLEDRVC